MARWAWLACLLLAGCFGTQGTGPASEAQHPADDEAVDGPGPTVQAGGPPPTAASGQPSGAELWFIHIELTCDDADGPCNCGSWATFMDRENSSDFCDGHGNRPFHQVPPPALEPTFQVAESWPAGDQAGVSSWPVGSTMQGTLYVTTDVQSSYDYVMRLSTTKGVVLAESAPAPGTVGNGALGLYYSALPFDAGLTASAPADAGLRLELLLRWHADATSYFIGYEGDHASWFMLSPPG